MKRYNYDLAISFAGEQRSLAEEIAISLDAAGYSIFYDRFEQAELWGSELTKTLGRVYAEDARYCLVLLSNEYLEKAWTNLERQNALGRFMQDRGNYLLCLRLDRVDLPGLPAVVAYVDFATLDGSAHLTKLLMQKLGAPDHNSALTAVNGHDSALSRDIIAACFRRAVFTRMDSEVDMRAMRGSIVDAIGTVQQIVPKLSSPSLQRNALEIITSLDSIDRLSVAAAGQISCTLPGAIKNSIDNHKRNVIRIMLEIRRAARLQIQLPFDLGFDHFFSRQDGDEPPRAAA